MLTLYSSYGSYSKISWAEKWPYRPLSFAILKFNITDDGLDSIAKYFWIHQGYASTSSIKICVHKNDDDNEDEKIDKTLNNLLEEH